MVTTKNAKAISKKELPFSFVDVDEILDEKELLRQQEQAAQLFNNTKWVYCPYPGSVSDVSAVYTSPTPLEKAINECVKELKCLK